MPRIERAASVVWEGNVARGDGRITAGSGAFADLPYSLPTRIGQAEGKTSPEELLASAHAGCFAMSLASELTSAGTPPTRLDVRCRIVMDEVDGEGHQIVESHVSVAAEAEGVAEPALVEAIERADAGCSFSSLLRKAGVELRITKAS
jgi:osmotically inducible protein OsmC